MEISDIKTEVFILALFIRDDGERFLLGSGAYEFSKDQLHFAANSFANDTVEVQGNDGVFLAGQVRRPSVQQFKGYVGDGSVCKDTIEQYRKAFFAFFRKNYFYTVVYVMPNGTAIQRKRGFIVEAPQVQELYQVTPEYSIGLNFEDTNYYTYAENSQGQEIYGKSATIAPLSPASGGVVWDEYGATWDNYGLIWEAGEGTSPTNIQVDSIDEVYPIWTVAGPVTNPTLTNLTTGVSMVYNGNVSAGSTLIVDMFNKTAKLNGTSVVGNLSGDWVYFAPGDNLVAYATLNSAGPACNVGWQEVVG